MITAVVGLQWGDEGKGRAVAELINDPTAKVSCVARANGGANAGHTVVHEGTRFKFHQIPVGAFYGIDCVLGPGMVIDPLALAEEIDFWEGQGSASQIYISDRAHVVLPKHKEEDARREAERGVPLGTTLRGNGPAYADKMLRVGTRLKEFIVNPPAGMFEAADFLARRMVDTTELLLDLLDRGEEVVLEGAHGVGLDIDHGDYPYVSSSGCTTSGLLASLGVPPMFVDRVVGVFKPYTTRVGAGPLPGEGAFPELEHWLREVGFEYGTTTGRPRKIGALDVRQVQRYAKICGVTDLFMTKGDLVSMAKAEGHHMPVIHANGIVGTLDDAGAFGEDVLSWVDPNLYGYVSTGPEAGQGVSVGPTY